MIVYVSIGNSDDKLTQRQWSMFYGYVDNAISALKIGKHGAWASSSTHPHQNACWCIEVNPGQAQLLKMELARLAVKFNQDSIAWAQVSETEFIGPEEGKS